MRLSDLDYELPSDLVAQRPLSKRDASRLLVTRASGLQFEDRHFFELPTLVEPSLFIFNDTRVIPARLFGTKESGGKVEVLLVREIDGNAERQTWSALCKSSKPMRSGQEITIAESDLALRVLRKMPNGSVELELSSTTPIHEVIDKVGHVPLPPYIDRPAENEDESRYQTVYAKNAGAVAAPTAGLHFSTDLLRKMKRAGHEIAFVTLHVGPGTFRPVKVDRLEEHPMHEEQYNIPESTIQSIRGAKGLGRRVVAVGTTVVRALEGTREQGELCSGPNMTSLFIQPGFEFKVVDDLITNFHLPRSTLLALVMAFGGAEMVRQAYAHAVSNQYRFFSYGDAMMIRGQL